MQQRNFRYKFYATLLDAYQDYLDSAEIYEKYWGSSDNPPCSLAEFQQKQFQGLIDRINRVPFDSEAADKGTAFNEVIDCMVMFRPSSKMSVERVYKQVVRGDVSGDAEERWADVEYTDEVVGLNVYYNNRQFFFPIDLVHEVSAYYAGALCQQYMDGVLPTAFGNVLLYGYIDYIMPFSVHDLKTTSRYSVGKFKNHWQHKVYPYVLAQNGCPITDFEYNVVEWGRGNNTFTEHYAFDKENDTEQLQRHCEDFIRFLLDNRSLIVDKKIFNLI